MRIKRGNRLFCLLSAISVFFLNACVTSPEFKLAQQEQMAGNLEAAHGLYMRVLQTDPNNIKAKQAVEAIRSQVTAKARREADDIYKNAAKVTAPVLRSCIDRLDKSSIYDPKGSYLGDDLKRYQRELAQIDDRNQERVKQITLAISEGDFEQASELIDEIKAADPDYPDIEAIETSYKKSFGVYLEEKIKKAYADNREKDAKAALDEWTQLGFPASERKRVQVMVKKQEKLALQGQYQQLLQKNRFYSAYLLLLRSGYKDMIGSEYSELKLKGGPFYEDQAKKRLSGGNAGRAFLEASKGIELDPENPELMQLQKDARDRLADSAQRYIAISTFASPKDAPDAGTRFADALIGYLAEKVPFGIQIVDREKIDLLMKEGDQDFTEVATALNVDLVVTGSVNAFSIERQENKDKDTVRVATGEKIETNPAYEAFMKANQGKNMAAAPPKTVRVKEFDVYTVHKGKATVKGTERVAVRMFDKEKMRVTYDQELSAEVRAQDEFQDGVPAAEVKEDPLELPGDPEIKEKLHSQIIQQMAVVILPRFQADAKGYLEKIAQHIDKKETDLAVNELAKGLLYCIKAQVDFDDPDFTEIRNRVVEWTESDFIL